MPVEAKDFSWLIVLAFKKDEEEKLLNNKGKQFSPIAAGNIEKGISSWSNVRKIY
ncbi:MAG: hypothetical protein ACQESS_11965 [Bacillota bacterium]